MYCTIRFFFFKQKTAYEMRISDWSSDVCSSDLYVAGVGTEYHPERRHVHDRSQDAHRDRPDQPVPISRTARFMVQWTGSVHVGSVLQQHACRHPRPMDHRGRAIYVCLSTAAVDIHGEGTAAYAIASEDFHFCRF